MRGGWEASVNAKYQWTLNNLEGLVVAHIFTLTKMNRSQTGEWSAALLLVYANT